MKNISIFLVAFGLLFAPVSAHAATASPAVTVTLDNFRFSPKKVTITPNTTIIWVHAQEGVTHDVDSDDHKSFASPDLNFQDTFSHKFRKAGIFKYHCTFHGEAGGVGMSGTITVKAKR